MGIVQGLAVPLVVASIALLSILTTALVGSRVRRSRREVVERRRRAAFAAMLRSGDPGQAARLVRASCEGYVERCDLVDVLRTLAGGHLALRAAAGVRSLLAAALVDLRHRDPTRRAVGAEIVILLSEGRELSGAEALLCTDRDLEVRQTVARALARRADDEAAWILIRALVADALPQDRILEQLGRPFAVRVVAEAIHIEQLRPIFPDLAEALGLARDAGAVFSLARLLRDGDERERTKACRALGRIRRKEAVPVLVEALADASETVRAVAARALGAIGDPRAVDALASSLPDRAWWVRANAAEALRHCGAAGILALERARTHPDGFARDRAEEALALAAAERRHRSSA